MMRAFLRELWQDESGQSMAEYGLLTALIAVVGLGPSAFWEAVYREVPSVS